MKSKKFGLGSIVLLGINSIIGTGIFLMPGKAFALVGTSSLLVYLFIALLAGSIALCFAEAAGLFSTNGSAYLYTKAAFGNFAGFEVGLMKYIVQIIAWATMAVGFVTALSAVFPAVSEGFWHDAIIVALLSALTLMNLAGIDVIRSVNNIVTFGKLAPLALFVVVGLFFMKPANFLPLVPVNMSQETFSSAAILVFYAFTGFEALATAAEDMENPRKNIPIAIALSMLLVALLYILIQVVSIGVLGTELAASTTPLVSAISVFMGDTGAALVTLGTLVSIGGINIAASFHTPRSCVALGEQHMLPNAVLKKNKRGVPYVAILLTFALTLPLALSGSFVYLATISVITRFAQYIPTCMAVIRFRQMGKKSTFTIPFGYTVPIVALIVAGWLLFNADLHKLIVGLGAMVVIVPLYFGMKWYNKAHGVDFLEDADIAGQQE